jgi:hypothetical protein
MSKLESFFIITEFRDKFNHCYSDAYNAFKIEWFESILMQTCSPEVCPDLEKQKTNLPYEFIKEVIKIN